MKIGLSIISLIFSVNLLAFSQVSLDHNLTAILSPEKGDVRVHDIFKSPAELPTILKIPVKISELTFRCDELELDYLIISKNSTTMNVSPKRDGLKCNSLEISYLFRPAERFEGEEKSALILSQGVYLSPSSYWYPRTNSIYERFKFSVVLPNDWSSMSTGTLAGSIIIDELKIENWDIGDYAEPIFLIANKFDIKKVDYKGVSLETYFHQGLAGHSQTYINKLKGIVDIYMDYFGYYPYKKFSVVSNFFSTGYGMASYTLLDKNIIPFPFIVARSLGHEFLHNYWGNSVFVSEVGGNWCEGLTSFQADYHYAELEGQGKPLGYRKNELRDYQNSVNESNVFPLKDFRYRYDTPSKSIGYGKALMVFHMLKNRLGADIFDRALVSFAKDYKFRFGAWSDIRTALEEESGENLSSFFHNWIDETEILNIELTLDGNSLNITQKGSIVFDIDVPVELTYGRSKELRIFRISDREQLFKVKASAVKLDPNFDLMRIISEQENAPTLKKFWGQSELNYYYSYDLDKGDLGSLNRAIATHPKSVKSKLKYRAIERKIYPQAYYFITQEQLDKGIIKQTIKRDEFTIKSGIITVAKTNFDLSKHVVVVASSVGSETTVFQSSPDRSSALKVANKVGHYGSYGLLIFDLSGKKVASVRW